MWVVTDKFKTGNILKNYFHDVAEMESSALYSEKNNLTEKKEIEKKRIQNFQSWCTGDW